MFLEKYKNIRKLGKGAYGDVFLVEDENNQELALKLITVNKIEAEPHLREYLEGEIDVMKQMNSQYIIRLYDHFEDKNYIYLLLEYCNGGDLINYQAKLKDRVFSL
jgi:serine/threonine protein kinase